MLRHTHLAMVSFVLLLGISSCGGSGSSAGDSSTPPPSTAARQVDLDPDDERCAYGGVLVQTGIDENRNGTLDDDEVDASEAVCNGAPGDDGLLSLLKRTTLPTGDANCPAGGEFIESGIDDNGNGTLEASEVDDSAYLCSSPASLLKRTTLAAGDANCPAGGEFIESGIDANGSGTLEPEEVDDSAYLCQSLSLLYAEKSSSSPVYLEACRAGGTEGQFGIDTNGNGTLDAAEVNVAIPIDCNTEAGLVLANEVTTDRWSARYSHSSVVFNGKLWVLGGQRYEGGDIYLNDVWSSEDGLTWEEATASAPWSARANHSSVVYDGKLWVLGGFSGGTRYFNDAWSSEDGVTWTQVTISGTSWSARAWHTSVVYDGKMWMLGGFDGSNSDDVWSSEDGVTWEEATSSAAWPARNSHSSVVFDDKLWILGGHRGGSDYLDDVWSSSDGASWTKATPDGGAAWPARAFHSSVVHAGKMWVIEGADGLDSYLGDVWSSSDGITWTDETPADAWSARQGHSSAVFDGSIWVLGGEVGLITYRNDVWVFAP